jgi:1-aminocyclopropane-1-carboxylate deaminase/D-cysteine desulfhydrase-like pyridoxal-dependent ACC family enzyme
MFDSIAQTIAYQKLPLDASVNLSIKRLDQIHAQISGNKFFKLKYNFLEAQKQGFDKVLTFGGAYSNHIAATAYAAHLFGLKSVGIIRGEELTAGSNTYLSQMNSWGMQLHFISRTDYRSKPIPSAYENYAVIAEGGFGELAIQGLENLVSELPVFDLIYTAVGTGATAIGIAKHTKKPVIGVLTLNNRSEIEAHSLPNNLSIEDAYVFGKYAKQNNELDLFCVEFHLKHGISIEPIYTGRMFYALTEHIKNGHIAPNTKLVAIHTGGVK